MPDERLLPTLRRCRGDYASAVVRRSGIAAAAGAALLTLAAACDASANGIRIAQRSEPRIEVAPTILAHAASQASLPIRIGPPGSLPNNSFVRLRGLPSTVSLTEGYAIGPGSWAVPLFSLPALKAVIPAGVSGRSELTISLVAVDGTLLAEARTALVVGSAAMMAPGEGQQPPSANVPSPPQPVPATRPERYAVPRAPELPPDEKARVEKLVGQGDRFLSQGNIAIARQFYQRAADAGYAPGAVKLAATFDPGELDRLEVQGVVPDRAEARKWYERARELGAPEAEERLARLGGS
ncbi:MAG: sel1 repeat family protein [Hyphomicrobiaceae bacterium]|nr:MAG: sel1 repeat family protein [Hyphomicrobiaceae bacterium]